MVEASKGGQCPLGHPRSEARTARILVSPLRIVDVDPELHSLDVDSEEHPHKLRA